MTLSDSSWGGSTGVLANPCLIKSDIAALRFTVGYYGIISLYPVSTPMSQILPIDVSPRGDRSFGEKQ